MAQIPEWGPHMWAILHVCAEHTGAYTTEIMMMDQIRAFISLLRHTEDILPCAMCKNHYRAWRLAHPLEKFLQYRGAPLKEAIRGWLWELHDSVNMRRELPEELRPTLEAVPPMYESKTSQDLQEHVTTLSKVLQTAILYRQVDPVSVANWKRSLGVLRRFIGF